MVKRFLKNKSIMILLLLLVFTIISACNKEEVKDSPLYKGDELTIGVVGETPEVREENIKFKNVTLEDLKESNFSSELNAIFIMKENLKAASKSPFAKVYKDSGVSFFFIESEKSYLPFVEEDIDYEDYSVTSPESYASGYYQSGDEAQYWDYGLYNDEVNKNNILDVYSRIFKSINQN